MGIIVYGEFAWAGSCQLCCFGAQFWRQFFFLFTAVVCRCHGQRHVSWSFICHLSDQQGGGAAMLASCCSEIFKNPPTTHVIIFNIYWVLLKSYFIIKLSLLWVYLVFAAVKLFVIVNILNLTICCSWNMMLFLYVLLWNL